MVAPIRDQENIMHSSTTMSFNTSDSISSQDLNMDVDSVSIMFKLDHIDNEVRGCSLDASIHRPRSPSMSSSECDKEYHIHVQRESEKMVEDNNNIEPANSRGSIRLKYAIQEGQNNQGSKVANTSLNTRQQHTPTVGPALNSPLGENMFDIQLNYNPDQALDPELWDGNFHAVSLHSSIEYIASDVLSIKNSLLRIKKYILGKSINGDKANNFKDLSGMGKAIWEFISSVYDLYWDVLFVNENNMTLRSKVKLKFALMPKSLKLQTKVKLCPNQPLFHPFYLLFWPNYPKKLKKSLNSLRKSKNLQ